MATSLSIKAVRSMYRQTYLEPGENPPKDGCLQNVFIEDICEGDHIMARYYQKVLSKSECLAKILRGMLVIGQHYYSRPFLVIVMST